VEAKLGGTAALVTGASSGIGAAHRPAGSPSTVPPSRRWAAAGTVWKPSPPIDKAGGTALAVEADITGRTEAEAAVQQAVERFGREAAHHSTFPLPGTARMS
jgi:NAD(P)-dependent dehydrogenase (short-subunit alcohol dehydrogenase family)